MPSLVATLIFVAGIMGLFWLERDPKARTSRALWIPIAWLFINSSRPVSMWMGAFGLGGPPATEDLSQIYLEGSPVDRDTFTFLLIAGLIVLASRSHRVGRLLRGVVPILLFFLYCAFSIFWSDFPLVTFKHLSKGIGDVVMVLVVLTDPAPTVAIKRLLTRVGFVLIPLSILFIKYYPALGRLYSVGGVMELTGASTQKNTLGAICVIFGLGSLWRLLAAYRDREGARRSRLLSAHGVILAMAVWLLWACNAVTSITGLVMASALMVIVGRPAVVRKPWVVHLLVAGILGLTTFALFFDTGGHLVRSVGRNPTLTGRTAIWQNVLPLAENPLIGAGYETFWLGERLRKFWTIDDGTFRGIQEAHNGYLELYLNLGWIGVGLLTGLIMAGYRKVIAAVRLDPAAGSLGLGFFVAELVCSFTEADFRMMSPLWIVLLLAIIGVPKAPVPEGPPPTNMELTYDLDEYEPQVDRALGVGFREDPD